MSAERYLCFAPGRLQQLLDEHNMRPAELARRIGVTPVAVANWLKGKTGQLDGRDRVVHNLGSVLAANLKVPS